MLSYQLLIILHLIGLAIGVGAATVADIMVFRFLKDFHISRWETKVLKTVSIMIWVGLAILILSGIGIYLQNTVRYNFTVKFLVKMVIVGIIILNGILLNLYITPRLVKLDFADHQLSFVKRITFASGAISMTSWYTVLILGALRNDVPLTFMQLLAVYLFLLSGAIAASQLALYLMDRKILHL